MPWTPEAGIGSFRDRNLSEVAGGRVPSLVAQMLAAQLSRSRQEQSRLGLAAPAEQAAMLPAFAEDVTRQAAQPAMQIGQEQAGAMGEAVGYEGQLSGATLQRRQIANELRRAEIERYMREREARQNLWGTILGSLLTAGATAGVGRLLR